MRTRLVPRFMLLLSVLTAGALCPTLAVSQTPAVTTMKPLTGAPAPAATRAPKLSPEMRALLEIEESGRQQVQELAKSLAGLPEGPVREAVQKRIAAAKLDTRVRILRARSQLALGRGDVAAAAECDRAVSRLTAPARPSNAAPANDRVKAAIGGAR
jgi:hypothetical protein